MIHKILSLFALLSVSFVSSQTIPKTENICFFQDAKSGKPITIVNDSLVYKGELKNPSRLKHTDYPGTLNDYRYYFKIKKQTFLVHIGCGPVLEYRNDSIVRIDNSFLHQNQYGSSPFTYKNQICLFGGYGLFTDKNIITRYDFTPNEWFLLNTSGENIPSSRSDNLYYFDEYGLYIFGGWNTKTMTTFKKDPCIWELNFNNLEWKCLGNYNENLLKIISKSAYNYYSFQTEKKLYIVRNDIIIEIDFQDNKINYFDNRNIILRTKPYFDSKNKSLVCLYNLSGARNLSLETISLDDLLKYPVKSEKLYYSPWQDYAVPILSIFLILILIFGIYKWINYKKRKCFIFNQTQKKLYYKTKIISNLDPLEEKIVVFLFQNNKTFIQLNQLNSFFEKESLDNFTNVIKKRDLVFASLFVKLNAYVMDGEKPLVLMQKNEVDKRIKEIKLNPLYFTLK
ncbi:MAG: hypothetical protein ACOYLT_10850 [Flavobacterium sp.]|uniref:hypothetical protein n=1 Tax=Flavobacterium sp. TaxID=239 RepID=UPI003BE88DE6